MALTRRGKILLGLAIGIPVAIALFSGAAAYLVLRTLDTQQAAPAAAAAAFEQARKAFPPRPPLIEVVDLRARNVRVNRAPNAPRRPVDKLHFLVYTPSDQEMMRGSMPAWLARMRVSITGIGNWSFSDLHITLEDIERYAPGIIVDFTTPDGEQIIVWAQ
jgi:hypothetical protein